MKTDTIIAVPTMGPGGLEAQVTTRFGRCAVFTLVELKHGEIEEVRIVENPGNNARGGAGPVAAQFISNEGAQAVIGGHYGPNAATALKSGKIQMFGPAPNAEITVKDLIAAFLEDKLAVI